MEEEEWVTFDFQTQAIHLKMNRLKQAAAVSTHRRRLNPPPQNESTSTEHMSCHRMWRWLPPGVAVASIRYIYLYIYYCRVNRASVSCRLSIRFRVTSTATNLKIDNDCFSASSLALKVKNKAANSLAKVIVPLQKALNGNPAVLSGKQVAGNFLSELVILI